MAAKFAERFRQNPPLLWLDGHAYGARLLAKDDPPLLDSSAFVAWQRKLLGLLKPDVAELRLAPVVARWIAAHADLQAAMAAKRRAVFPLRTLLADEPLRVYLSELTRAFRAAVGGQPLVLVLPSPRAWVGLAYRQTHGEAVEVGDDEADSAAVYIADFLRGLGDAGVDALLLEEAAADEPASADAVALYQPVFNLAAHYQWDVGLRLPTAANFSGVPSGLAFVIAPHVIEGAANGVVIEPAFWSGGEAAPAAPAGGFRYAGIPPGSSPETVLERLALLRQPDT